MPPGFTMPYNC